MKKITAIFLLLFFCLFQSGHFLVYLIQLWQIQHAVRNEIIAGVPDRYLDAVIYDSQVHWEEEGREFTLGNEFYDVVRIRKINGQTILYCLNDKKEEQLINNFGKLLKTGTEREQSKNNKHAFNFQLLDEIKEPSTTALHYVDDSKKNYGHLSPGLASNFKEIIIPPPR